MRYPGRRSDILKTSLTPESERVQVSEMSSSDYSSSESEVEYEPIMIEDTEGKKILMKEESNPLAPIVIVNTKAADKSLKIKKQKVFATKGSMLSLIESVNTLQDTKIQQKLDRDASYLQRLNNIEKATKERKSMKNERLDKIKDNLRKGGVRVKGENKKKVRDIQEKEKEAVEGGRGKKSFGKSRGPPSKGANGSKGSKGGAAPAKSSRGAPSKNSKGGPSGKIQKKVKFAV